jgi:aerobic-type carbon monoxide dehydrogenase small subunit (CoxS/CutS family)
MALHINGRQVDVDACQHESLAEVLRERLGLRGTKVGCDSGECGACTVMIDGAAVNSCVTLAGSAVDSKITTVEGLASGGVLHKLQQAFLDHGAFQCGYCTSGMLMSAAALLQLVNAPTDGQIRDALQGNICRCTGYVQILAAVRSAIGESS